jgi:hypothetical protein
MSQFRDRSWDQRLGQLGDEAETKFAEWATEYPFGFAPFGLSRPPIQVHKLPDFVRYTPDFITTKYLYEVQGHGREGVTKIKIDKLDALLDWSAEMPVRLFLWNSSTKTRYDVPLMSYHGFLYKPESLRGSFDDGKKPWLGFPDAWLTEYIV